MSEINHRFLVALRCIGVGIAAATLMAAPLPCGAEDILFPPTRYMEGGYDVNHHRHWTNSDDYAPELLDFSFSFDYSTDDYGVHPPKRFTDKWSYSGFVETFDGSLPRIQVSMQGSVTGPKNTYPWKSRDFGASLAGEIYYYVGAVPKSLLSKNVPAVPLTATTNASVTESHSGSGRLTLRANVYYWLYNAGGDGFFLNDHLWGGSFDDVAQTHTGQTNDGGEDIIDFSLPTGRILEVRLLAGADMKLDADNLHGEFGSMNVTAYVDPIITIDPDWEFADDYTLVYSNGIEQYVVPEPSGCALAIWILLALCAVGWRRRGRSGVPTRGS